MSANNRNLEASAGHRGFTLIEVMIVVVIVGVLLMVALPAYQDSVRKSRRADGMRALMEMAARQERFYAQNSSYSDKVNDPNGLDYDSSVSTDGYYSYASAAGSCGDLALCYVLTATPVGAQVKDTKCASLTFNSLGQRKASGTLGDACW